MKEKPHYKRIPYRSKGFDDFTPILNSTGGYYYYFTQVPRLIQRSIEA